MALTPVGTEVQEATSTVQVSSAAGSAGASLGITTKTFKVQLVNRSGVSADLQYKVGAGAWETLRAPDGAVSIGVDLSATTILVRKGGPQTGSVPIEVTTYSAGDTQAGTPSTPIGSGSTPTYPNLSALQGALPAGSNAGKLAIAGNQLYLSDGTAWNPVGGAGAPKTFIPFMRGVNLFTNAWSIRGTTRWPKPFAITYFLNKGFNCFRINTLWENLQFTLNGPLDPTELGKLTSVVDQITQADAYAIIDFHNAMRWKVANTAEQGSIVGESSVTIAMFADVWGKMAAVFRGNPRVIFNLSNEPQDQSTEILVQAYNAAITAVRSAGANNLIMLDGNDFSDPLTWVTPTSGRGSNAVNMLNVVDPINNLVFDTHRYFDQAGGSTATCIAGEGLRSEYLGVVIKWARDNNKRLFHGEFGGGNNSQCLLEIEDAVNYVEANSDVYMGWAVWGAFGDTISFSPGTPWIFGLDDPVSFNYSNPVDDPRTTLLSRYTRPKSNFVMTDLGVTKLRGWYKPSTATVSAWPDSSGNSGRDFAQATGGNQPTLNTTLGGITTTSTQYMDAAGLSSGSAANTEIMVAVISVPTIGGRRELLQSNPSSAGREVAFDVDGKLFVANQGNSGVLDTSTTVLAGGSKQLVYFAGASAGTAMRAAFNAGAEIAGYGATGFTGAGVTRLGPMGSATGPASIHEVVLLSATTTLGERAKVIGRLMWDHGITSLAPASPTYIYRGGRAPFTIPGALSTGLAW